METAELRGLVLLGDDGDVPFAADAPWPMPAGTGLSDALERVWASVAGNCPGFLTALRTEVLGLALVVMKGRYLLGYLLGYLHLADRSGKLPLDLKDLAPYPGSNSLTVLWGTARPVSARPTSSFLDEPLPVGVRDLAAVHASLASFDFDLRLDHFTTTLGATTLADYEREDPADYEPDGVAQSGINGTSERPGESFTECGSPRR
ncbi:hypothetical protein [Embleya sp. NPDC001921]